MAGERRVAVTMNPNTLATYGQALLANIAADLTGATLTAPSRRMFVHGPPPRDCDQLAVWWQGLNPSFGGRTLPSGPAVETAPRHATPVVTWAVDLVVCPPDQMSADVPSPAVLTAAAVLGARYGWVLWRSLTARWVVGNLFEPYKGRAGQGMAPSVPQPMVDGGLIVVTASFAFNHLQEPPP